jgi:hypothetical protein
MIIAEGEMQAISHLAVVRRHFLKKSAVCPNLAHLNETINTVLELEECKKEIQ